ncbi:MAG: hypothetical protein PF588_03630 [Candidatus Kapabacteria bacterium]|jgi:WD40 repeat protein|nr:hypothetical protein [Candidatus Kapabacteria bacterium]
MSVSDNGTLSATVSDTMYFYYISNRKYLFSHKFNDGKPTDMHISSDGKYLAVTLSYNEYNIYEIENNKCVYLAETGKYCYLLFDPEDSSKLLIQDDDSKTIKFLNLSPYSIIAEMETNENIVSIDFYNNKFATRGNMSGSEYRLEGFELLKKVPVSNSVYASFYKNDMIYMRYGIKFKLGN